MKAYKSVKENRGSAGVDNQTVEEFEKDYKGNLYKLWNRMSSGSYFPKPVKAVTIPKKNGGERVLGVPTVTDRIAQMVIRMMLEPEVEPHFHENSYGYRPNKSAIEAIGITRQRCWKYNWVVEYDIKGLFDNIRHDLLIKAVKTHTNEKVIILYIERWLAAKIETSKGQQIERKTGTPQGSVISPLLSNLFLHYAIDKWMERKYPQANWSRYADDGLIHCKTEREAQNVLSDLGERLNECGLEMNEAKSGIIYCKDDCRRRKVRYRTEFTYLGYTFKQRKSKNKRLNKLFQGFSPAVSKDALKAMRAKTKSLHIRNMTTLSLEGIAKMYNPVLRGWLEYYGKYNKETLNSVWRHLNQTLVRWAMKKHKKFKRNKRNAIRFLSEIAYAQPELFVHWKREKVMTFS